MSNGLVRSYYWSLVFLFVPGAQLLTSHHIPCISGDSVCSVTKCEIQHGTLHSEMFSIQHFGM